jgi:hypothetical protein
MFCCTNPSSSTADEVTEVGNAAVVDTAAKAGAAEAKADVPMTVTITRDTASTAWGVDFMSTKQAGGGDALCVKAIAAGGAFEAAQPKLRINDLVIKVGGQSGVMDMVDTLKKQTTVQLTVLREA